MNKSLQDDTLQYQLNTRPWTQPAYIGWVELPEVIRAYKTFYSGPGLGAFSGIETSECVKGCPEQDALIFYLLNHAVSVIKSKVHSVAPLGDYLPIVQEYNRQLSMRSIRMFYYLLIICTRESRHERSSLGGSFWGSLEGEFGTTITGFCAGLRGKGSAGAVERLRDYPPDTQLGAYTKFLVKLFEEGSYGSGYGGVAWAAVAKVLNDYVHGTLTAELMMDTAFTLCHNNGPIFNKGVLFDNYSDYIYRILDVQRSGQIPQLFNWSGFNKKKYPMAVNIYDQFKGILPEEFAGTVDWVKVKELGAVKSYTNEIKAQLLETKKDDFEGADFTGYSIAVDKDATFGAHHGMTLQGLQGVQPYHGVVTPTVNTPPANGKVIHIMPGVSVLAILRSPK